MELSKSDFKINEETEIHSTMKNLNFKKFMEIIRENIPPSTERTGFLEPLIEYTIKVAKSGTERSFFKKTGELVEINSVIKNYINNWGPEGDRAVKDVVAFVLEQPDDFKRRYISNLTYDCMNAFPESTGNARKSCPAGQYERIYMNFKGVLESFCLGNEKCPPLYSKLYSCFRKTTLDDINDLFLEWFKTQNIDKDNFDEMSSRDQENYVNSKSREFKDFAIRRIDNDEIIDEYIRQNFRSVYSIGGKKKRKTIQRKNNKKRRTQKRKNNKKRRTQKRK